MSKFCIYAGSDIQQLFGLHNPKFRTTPSYANADVHIYIIPIPIPIPNSQPKLPITYSVGHFNHRFAVFMSSFLSLYIPEFPQISSQSCPITSPYLLYGGD
jgi:hypothetical protein